MGRVLTVRVVPRAGATLRAAAASVLVLGVLAVGHVWAGGELPSPVWLALMGITVFGAGLVVLHRRVPARAAVPLLVAAQLLLHAWLTALAPMAHHDHGHSVAAMTLPMLTVHVAGGVLTAVVWRLAARAVEVVVSWVRLALPPVPPARRAPAPVLAPAALARRFVVAAAPRRGPPAGVLAPA